MVNNPLWRPHLSWGYLSWGYVDQPWCFSVGFSHGFLGCGWFFGLHEFQPFKWRWLFYETFTSNFSTGIPGGVETHPRWSDQAVFVFDLQVGTMHYYSNEEWTLWTLKMYFLTKTVISRDIHCYVLVYRRVSLILQLCVLISVFQSHKFFPPHFFPENTFSFQHPPHQTPW